MPTMNFDRTRPLALRSAIVVDDDDDDAPVKPVRVPRDDTQMLASLAQRLNINDAGDWSRVSKLQRYLDANGIETVEDLQAKLAASMNSNGRFTPPPLARRSLSPLYSDIEIIDWLKVDTLIVPITTVAISTTLDFAIPQAPVRWQITDFTADGVAAGGGRKDQIEIRVVLGTTEITAFRLSAMDKTSAQTTVVDALTKIYACDIGPNSTLKVRVVNLNSTAGMTFDGHFQLTRRPVMDDSLQTIMARMAL